MGPPWKEGEIRLEVDKWSYLAPGKQITFSSQIIPVRCQINLAAKINGKDTWKHSKR